MPKRKHLIELLAALRLLQKREIPATNLGICGNLICYFEMYDGEYEPVMYEALGQIGWYTKDVSYPIPSDFYDDPSDAYHNTENKWDLDSTYTRSYAQRRFELVDRMIDVCIKHIDSPSSKLSVLK